MKKPTDSGSGKKAAQKKKRKKRERSELAVVVAQLAQSAEKLAQAADRLAATAGHRPPSKRAQTPEPPDFTTATDAGS